MPKSNHSTIVCTFHSLEHKHILPIVLKLIDNKFTNLTFFQYIPLAPCKNIKRYIQILIENQKASLLLLH